jgi:hypothetical protein
MNFEEGKTYTIKGFKTDSIKPSVEPHDVRSIPKMANDLQALSQFAGDSKDYPMMVQRVLNTYLATNIDFSDDLEIEEQKEKK